MVHQRMPQAVSFEAESPEVDPLSRLSSRRGLAQRLRSGLSADALRYHFLAEQLREVVFHLDGGGHLTFLGPTWTGLTGRGVEDVLGQPLVESVHPEDRPRLLTVLEALSARVQASFRLELRLLASGGPLWVELSAHSSPTGDGEVLGTLADLSERRQMQARLQQSDRLATLGLLIPGFAHEMNNPLAFMLANLEYLLSRMEEAPASAQVADWREVVGEVREGAERLRELIGHLRGFQGEGSSGPVDVHRVLDAVGKMTSSTLRTRARLLRDYDAGAAVAGGESQLRQLFLNLVLHAALSIPEGGDPEAHEVRLVTREDGQGHVVVEVRDTGRGIAPELLPHVFDPLYTPYDGEGGPAPSLAVCQELVRGLGGSLTVTSTPGRGTRFRVTLPALS